MSLINDALKKAQRERDEADAAALAEARVVTGRQHRGHAGATSPAPKVESPTVSRAVARPLIPPAGAPPVARQAPLRSPAVSEAVPQRGPAAVPRLEPVPRPAPMPTARPLPAAAWPGEPELDEPEHRDAPKSVPPRLGWVVAVALFCLLVTVLTVLFWRPTGIASERVATPTAQTGETAAGTTPTGSTASNLTGSAVGNPPESAVISAEVNPTVPRPEARLAASAEAPVLAETPPAGTSDAAANAFPPVTAGSIEPPSRPLVPPTMANTPPARAPVTAPPAIEPTPPVISTTRREVTEVATPAREGALPAPAGTATTGTVAVGGQLLRPEEAPLPQPNLASQSDPAVIAFLEASRITGVRVAGSDSRVLMNNQVYRLGSLVHNNPRIRISQILTQEIRFIDESGAEYRKQFQ